MRQSQILKKTVGAGQRTTRAPQQSAHCSQPVLSNHRLLAGDAHGVVQRKLAIGAANDRFEQEAVRVADRIMSGAEAESTAQQSLMGTGRHGVQRKNRLPLQRKGSNSELDSRNTPLAASIVHEVLHSPGQPLDEATRAFMEPRFGHNFSQVRVHTDSLAARSADDVSARAYTVGNNVVFAAGQYAPTRREGRCLIAHELTHVVQQGGQFGPIQRECSDPDFCTPYATAAEADSAEWWIRNTYFRLEGIETFGTEVKGLYDSFLSRKPGDSLAPVVFSGDSSYLVSSFKGSGDTTDDIDAVIDLVGSRLGRTPGPRLRDSAPTMMSMENFLSRSEMDNRPINYSNPFSVAGHIAGGLGSSDAGDDYRKITYANVTLERTTLIGSTGYTSVEVTPQYEIFDAIDFCPGDCGSPAEQLITIPMSRLEASGAAYDLPFKVIFTAEPRSKRFWF